MELKEERLKQERAPQFDIDIHHQIFVVRPPLVGTTLGNRHTLPPIDRALVPRHIRAGSPCDRRTELEA